MIVRNVSSKIIGVGSSKVIMPDKEIKMTKEAFNVPSIQAFVKLGYLIGIEEASDKPARNAKPKNTEEVAAKHVENVTAEPVEETVVAEKPAKPRGRGRGSKAAEKAEA